MFEKCFFLLKVSERYFVFVLFDVYIWCLELFEFNLWLWGEREYESCGWYRGEMIIIIISYFIKLYINVGIVRLLFFLYYEIIIF